MAENLLRMVVEHLKKKVKYVQGHNAIRRD